MLRSGCTGEAKGVKSRFRPMINHMATGFAGVILSVFLNQTRPVLVKKA